MNKINLVAPCLFGIESVAADEFRRMGFEDIKTENGRVLLSGDSNMLARANISSQGNAFTPSNKSVKVSA